MFVTSVCTAVSVRPRVMKSDRTVNPDTDEVSPVLPVQPTTPQRTPEPSMGFDAQEVPKTDATSVLRLVTGEVVPGTTPKVTW